MSNPYSDIKRYDLAPSFLFIIARKVINYLGWDIQQESERKINAFIPKESGSLCSEINVIVHRGYITLNSECNAEVIPQYYIESQARVNQFLENLDNHLEAIPPEQLNHHAETFGHSLWSGKSNHQRGRKPTISGVTVQYGLIGNFKT